MTIPSHAAEVRLVRRPVGTPVADDFDIVSAPLVTPGAGQVLVRNEYLSVDPYMRGRMIDARSYAEPYPLDAAMTGGAVGTVVRSEAPHLPVGSAVVHDHGWREYALVQAGACTSIDTTVAPASAYLGVLGMPGQAAYFGLLEVGEMRPGDTVFVSGAAGAVGGLVGQFARLRGARRVIGSAGSPEKVAYLTDELGFDAAFDYHDGPVREQLRGAAPDGIDVYFDNVGGDHLRAALAAIRPFGRIALCGAISGYNSTTPNSGPDNLVLAVGKRLNLRGFVVHDFADRIPEFEAQVGRWVLDDQVRLRETVVSGVHNAVPAFLGLFEGTNTGKMLVRLPGAAPP